IPAPRIPSTDSLHCARKCYTQPMCALRTPLVAPNLPNLDPHALSTLAQAAVPRRVPLSIVRLLGHRGVNALGRVECPKQFVGEIGYAIQSDVPTMRRQDDRDGPAGGQVADQVRQGRALVSLRSGRAGAV